MPRPARILLALVVAVSLLGGWTVQAAISCGGSCCVAEKPAPRWMGHGGLTGDGVEPGGCCCGGEAAPCDLERGELPDTPPRALTAVPKVEPPAAGLLAADCRPTMPGHASAGARRSGTDPPDRAPPGPLYLQHLSFLC